MKRLVILLFILKSLLIQNTCFASSSKESEHSYLSGVWNFITGKEVPQEVVRDTRMKNYGKYVDPTLNEFERVEHAALFSHARYHFDNALDLSDFCEDPNMYVMRQWRKSFWLFQDLDKQHNEQKPLLRYPQLYETGAFEWKKSITEGVKFEMRMCDLAHQFVSCYQKLSAEEKKAAIRQAYGHNGARGSNPGLAILGDVERVQETLCKNGTQKPHQEIYTAMATTAKNFRDEACKEDDERHSRLDEYTRRYGPDGQIKKHACVYATLLVEYVQALQKYSAETDAIRDIKK